MLLKSRAITCSAFVFGAVLSYLVTGIPAAAHPSEYSEISDRALLKSLHTKEARAEVDRRLNMYTGEQRSQLEEWLSLFFPPDDFLADVQDKELIHLLGYWRAEGVARVAAMTLAERAANGLPEERSAIHRELTRVAESMDYSEVTVPGQAAEEARRAYNCYTRNAATVLPEGEALDVLAEVYFKEDDLQSWIRYLDMVAGSVPVKGAATAATVARLLDELPQGIARLQYVEEVGAIKNRAELILADCGESGLPVLESTDWYANGTGVLAMGRIGNERAQALLVEQYEKFPTDARRLEVLNALAVSLRKRNDPEFKQFLHTELPRYLAFTPNDEPVLRNLEYAVAIAKATQDPHFQPYLESLQLEMTPENLERAHEYQRATQSEWDDLIRRFDANVAKAIESLTRAAAARTAQEPEQSQPADEPTEPQRALRPRLR